MNWQEAELLKICVSSFIIWLKLNWEVAISTLDPSKCVISFWYQPRILALKSSNTTTRNWLLLSMCSKLSSKFLMKFSNSSFVWLEIHIDWRSYMFCRQFNLKVNTFLKIWHTYGFQRQYTHWKTLTNILLWSKI